MPHDISALSPEELTALLSTLRERITRRDLAITSLLKERLALALEIGAIKQVLGRDIFDPDVENEKFRRLVEDGGPELPPELIHAIFEPIIAFCRGAQQTACT